MRTIAEDHGVPTGVLFKGFVEALCGGCSREHPTREVDGFELIHDAKEWYVRS